MKKSLFLDIALLVSIAAALTALLGVLVSGCALEVAPVEVDLETEELVATLNNSCLSLHAAGCTQATTRSIAEDSSPKRACMRGYFKKKGAGFLASCDTANGEGDKCYDGTKFTAGIMYRATRCADFGAIDINGVGRFTRKCDLMRMGNPNNGGSGEVREAIMFYASDRCQVFEENHSQPTQEIRYGENRPHAPAGWSYSCPDPSDVWAAVAWT